MGLQSKKTEVKGGAKRCRVEETVLSVWIERHDRKRVLIGSSHRETELRLQNANPLQPIEHFLHDKAQATYTSGQRLPPGYTVQRLKSIRPPDGAEGQPLRLPLRAAATSCYFIECKRSCTNNH